MKKLFVALMVLVLCGAASATTVSLQGEGTTITVSPVPSVVRINIVTSASGGTSNLWALDVCVTVTGGDVITQAMNPTDDPGNPNAYGWDYAGLPISPTGVGTASIEEGGTNFNVMATGTVGYVDVTYTGGTQVVSLVGCTGFGGSFDDNFATPTFSTGVVTLVPEPMTIALLGLGGLLLRRRK